MAASEFCISMSALVRSILRLLIVIIATINSDKDNNDYGLFMTMMLLMAMTIIVMMIMITQIIMMTKNIYCLLYSL